MTVSAAELTTLKCVFSYFAAYIAIAEQYGIECNTDYYQQLMCRADRYIFLSENCTANVTEDLICEIKDFISKWGNSEFYSKMSECSDGSITCGISSTIQSDTACTSDLNINILL